MPYVIHFQNESIGDERVKPWPQRFRGLPARLVDSLQTEFLTWHGRVCFETAMEHQRAFGARYPDKAESPLTWPRRKLRNEQNPVPA